MSLAACADARPVPSAPRPRVARAKQSPSASSAPPARLPPPASVRVPPPSISATASSPPLPPPPAPKIHVTTGVCKLREVPPGQVQHVGAGSTRELAAAVSGWLNLARGHDGAPMEFASERGIAFAQSAAPVGYDGPRKERDKAKSGHVCGADAERVLADIRLELEGHAHYGIVCQKNVCCYDAGNAYDSAGVVVFRRRKDRTWVLAAFMRVADNGALDGDVIARSYRETRQALAQHTKATCHAGESGR